MIKSILGIISRAVKSAELEINKFLGFGIVKTTTISLSPGAFNQITKLVKYDIKRGDMIQIEDVAGNLIIFKII